MSWEKLRRYGAPAAVALLVVMALPAAAQHAGDSGFGTVIDEPAGLGPFGGPPFVDRVALSADIPWPGPEALDGAGLDFNSDRIQAAAILAGSLYSGTWRVSPGLSLSWEEERLEDTSRAPSRQTVETVTLTPILAVGNTLDLGGGTSLEPWLGGGIDWIFLNRAMDEAAGTILDETHIDLRLNGGVTVSFGRDVQLGFSVELGGLLLENSGTYAGEINLAIQF